MIVLQRHAFLLAFVISALRLISQLEDASERKADVGRAFGVVTKWLRHHFGIMQGKNVMFFNTRSWGQRRFWEPSSACTPRA